MRMGKTPNKTTHRCCSRGALPPRRLEMRTFPPHADRAAWLQKLVLLGALNVVAMLLMFCQPARAAENGSGAIIGTVRLTGRPPSIPIVYAEQDMDVCGPQSRPSQCLVLGTNQTVQGAVVYLGVAASNGKPSTNETAFLDQRDCEFVPRIQIARSGAVLILKNSDPLLHVVRIDSMSGTNGPTPILNVATPYAGFEKSYSLAGFKEPTLLKAVCGNGHNWMAAYIAVMPHPWAALTDNEGKFILRGVPAGNHKLYVWQEALGTLARDIKVTSDLTTRIDLAFSGGR